MLFSSLIFLFLFLPAVLFCYFVLCKSRKLKNRFLLLASLFFYGWGEPIYVFLMMGCIFGNYCFGRLIHHYQERSKAAKTSLVLMLVFNLGILAYFKYAGFFVENLNLIKPRRRSRALTVEQQSSANDFSQRGESS